METAAPPALLAGVDPAEVDRPLLTFYDDATGERTELSAVALAGWASRTAGLLHEDCGLGAGHRAAVVLSPHWQTAAVLLGAWSAGVSVSVRLTATAGLPPLGAGEDEPFDAVFVSRRRLDDWLEEVPVARHRFALDLDPPPAPAPPSEYRDYLEALRPFTDRLPAYAPIRRGDAATVDGTSYRQWGDVAAGVAESLDLRAGDRVLVDAGRTEHPVMWLLAPLAARASIVLCANLDPTAVAARVEREGVTRLL